MKKKSKAEVSKLVDAQARGKKIVGANTDSKTPEGKDLDVRASKYVIKQG
jgi:hypothetical protein